MQQLIIMIIVIWVKETQMEKLKIIILTIKVNRIVRMVLYKEEMFN